MKQSYCKIRLEPFHQGYGIAIDVGTTTLVAQLIDLQQGKVEGAANAVNPQGRYGSDIMSRIEYAVHQDQKRLTSLIREKINHVSYELNLLKY